MYGFYQGALICFWFTELLLGSHTPVFLQTPSPVNALPGSVVNFLCVVVAEEVDFYVNGTRALDEDVVRKGFYQSSITKLNETTRQLQLTANVSSTLYNKTVVECRGLNTKDGLISYAWSDSVFLLVQGPLSSVCNLSYYFINSSTVNISWSAPFTLPGTYITGYNISVTSINGTSSDLFTLNNYYLLYLMEIRNCYVMNIAVSGFNGQNGETEVLTVSSTECKKEATSSLVMISKHVALFTVPQSSAVDSTIRVSSSTSSVIFQSTAVIFTSASASASEDDIAYTSPSSYESNVLIPEKHQLAVLYQVIITSIIILSIVMIISFIAILIIRRQCQIQKNFLLQSKQSSKETYEEVMVSMKKNPSYENPIECLPSEVSLQDNPSYECSTTCRQKQNEYENPLDCLPNAVLDI